ncbi:UNVERIFIED_CONTAM: hypothetical protein Sangu_3210700 [Sesamum angustifolium]|uniref:Secreted protein n=1 Tax=Sesamum angustifolium TaxID=2727405 RepID=A0AAW2JMB9_9LAMI
MLHTRDAFVLLIIIFHSINSYDHRLESPNHLRAHMRSRRHNTDRGQILSWNPLSSLHTPTALDKDYDDHASRHNLWACWIPAQAAITPPTSRFSHRHKRAPTLAAVGFLCCIPVAKAFHCPERPVSVLRRPTGPRRGGPRGTRCARDRVRPVRARAVGPRRRRPISRMRKTRWV